MAIIWNNDLGGSINNNTPGLLANNEFDLALDVSQAQSGNVAHRLGSDLYLNSVSASNAVRGLDMYQKNNDLNYLHMVHDGNLYVNGVSTWTLQDSNEWAVGSNIEMANYINRHYMASSTSGEFLKYATDTGSVVTAIPWTTTVSATSTGSTLVISENKFSEFVVGMTIYNTTDGTNTTITGYTNPTTVTTGTAINDTWDNDTVVMYTDPKYLVVNGAFMLTVGNSVFPRRTYFTRTDSANIEFATDFFITQYTPTGAASFGNGRSFVIFTKNDYTVVDPAQPEYTDTVDGFGCVSHRSIVSVKGNLIYLGQDAFYLLATSGSAPIDTARRIKNNLTGDALFNKIDKSLLSVTAAGTIGDYYYCAVRNLSGTVRGKTIQSAIFVIDLSQDNWKVETYVNNTLASVFARFTDANGNTDLYGGSYSNGTVYKIGVMGLYTDDNRSGVPQTVTSTVLTKHYEYIGNNGVTNEIMTDKLWFKYKSSSTISVSYSLNGATSYTLLGNLPAYTTTEWTYQYIDLGTESRTIGLELSFTGNTIIYAIGFEGKLQKGQGIKGL